MNLPTDVEKHLTKSIIHFMIKILSKLGLLLLLSHFSRVRLCATP